MRRIALIAPLAAFCVVAHAPGAARADETGSTMAEAARRFVAALDPGQAARATFPYESPERLNWHWIPRERQGLPIKALGPEERALAFALINTGLSTTGALRAATVMSQEEILRVDENGTGPVRDPELYFLSIFGTPSDSAPWGWRVEGHHLALNFTLAGGKVVGSTPFMFGANPATVRKGPRAGLRNLADIEGPAYSLMNSLTPDQRTHALAAEVAPDVTTTPNAAQAPTSIPEGIAADDLTAAQKADLAAMLHAYAGNFPGPVRAKLLDEIDRGLPAAHFAWYGAFDPSKNHAIHVQSPTFYLDFNNTQNGTNHIHTFFRSFVGDFGVVITH